MKTHEIHVVHANVLYKKYFSQATWALKRLWERYSNRYENLWQAFPRREDAGAQEWERLIQARHKVMAIMQCLRDRDEWDEDYQRPFPEKFDGDSVTEVA